MNDKEKQVEGMAKDIVRSAGLDVYEKAEYLYNAGYRKIPEDRVVLTKEEYEKLKQYEEKVKSGACFTQKEWLELCDEECKRNTENLLKARQLERKETAEKILKWILETFGDLWAKIDEVYDICNYISRQYGVEIGEEV